MPLFFVSLPQLRLPQLGLPQLGLPQPRRCLRLISPLLWGLWLLLWVGLLGGCSASKAALQWVGLGRVVSHNALSSIAVEALPNSNLNTPVALDIVFIDDSNIASLLADLSGPEWFVNRPALLKRYDQQLAVVSLEVVPLSYLASVVLPSGHQRARHIVIFTNYRVSHGQYMADITHFKQLKIRLLPEHYELVNLD